MKSVENQLKEDFEKRSRAFLEELAILEKKYRVTVTANASLTPDGRIQAMPLLANTDKLVQQEEPEEQENKIIEA